MDFTVNSYFTTGWHHYQSVPELYIAGDWAFKHWDRGQGAPPEHVAPLPGDQLRHLARPELKQMIATRYPRRVLPGHPFSLCGFKQYAPHIWAVWQRCQVPVGERVYAQVKWHTWCSRTGHPDKSEGEMYLALGIDLAGGTDPWSTSVVWTDWERGGPDPSKDIPDAFSWHTTELALTSTGAYATVFAKVLGKWASDKNSDMYLGCVRLFSEDDPEPIPDPEPPPDCDPAAALAKYCQWLASTEAAAHLAAANVWTAARQGLETSLVAQATGKESIIARLVRFIKEKHR